MRWCPRWCLRQVCDTERVHRSRVVTFTDETGGSLQASLQQRVTWRRGGPVERIQISPYRYQLVAPAADPTFLRLEILRPGVRPAVVLLLVTEARAFAAVVRELARTASTP